MDEIEIFNVPLIDAPSLGEMVIRFLINTFFVFILIQFFYYKKSRRLDYYFTFTLISISIFFLIYLLGSVKIKVGMALGLFAIFGIIRYRTETIPVREMTYLFVIISLSVINAIASNLSIAELFGTNIIYVLSVWVVESFRGGFRHLSSKLILYDRIDNIKPDQREELIADLRKRTGLKIMKVDVGAINFLQDTVMLKIYYETGLWESSSVDHLLKLPKDRG
ncbi:MAG: DUF4956 domain-containing protein [Muribaculaceae bacterium]|nr:DUF4956 domain-containing protein [Muribaculaceae bacterium]